MMKKFALLVFVAGAACPQSSVASFEGVDVGGQGKKAEVNRFAGKPSGAGKAAKLSPEARAQAATVDAALQRAFVIERHARHLAEAGALRAAESEFGRAIEALPKDRRGDPLGGASLYRFLSRVKADQGQFQQGYEDLMKAHPGPNDFEVAYLLFKLGRAEEAQSMVPDSVLMSINKEGVLDDFPPRSDPRGLEACLLYCRALSRGYDHEERGRLADLNEAFRLWPTSAKVADAIATHYWYEDDLPRARPFMFVFVKYGHGPFLTMFMQYLSDEQIASAGGREAILARAGR